MKQDQEKRLEKIMNSLNAVEQVEPSYFLYAKIRHKIDERLKQRNILSGRFVWKVSVVFMLLVVLNVFALYVYPTEIIQETAVVAEEFGFITADHNYYNYSE